MVNGEPRVHVLDAFKPTQDAPSSSHANLAASKALLPVGGTAIGTVSSISSTPTTCSRTEGGQVSRWWQITSETDHPGAEFDAIRLYNANAATTTGISMRNELDNAAVYVYSSKANSVANVVDWFIDDIGTVPSAEDGGKVIAFGERRPVYRLAVVLHRISALTVCGFEALADPTTITRRCLAAEFEAEGTNSADKPLTHEEGDTNYLQGANSAGNKCSGSGHGLTGPGWWFVKFRDGKKHKVSKIRLWNRAGCCPDRLNGACVRFATDNSVKPPIADPSQNCDDYLPDDVASNSGPGSGTWLRVDRWIVGMMLISRAADYYITICGIEIYEEKTRYPNLRAAGCVVQEDTAYHNFDVAGNGDIPVGISLSECVHRCTQNTECFGVLYKKGNRACMLKADGAFAESRKHTDDVFDSVELPPNSACRAFRLGGLLVASDVDTDQGPSEYWPSYRPLSTAAGNWDEICSHTAAESEDNRGYWYANFKAGAQNYVTKIEVWNRKDCCSYRLNSACVRYSTDGTKPSNADPSKNCDDYLPADVGFPTELMVGRSITGLMFINNHYSDYVMSLCGIKIYKAFTSTTTTTTAAAGGVEDLAAVPAEFAENCVRETRRMGRKNLLNTAAAGDYVVESDGPLSSPYLPGVTTMVGCLQWCAETKTCGGAVFSSAWQPGQNCIPVVHLGTTGGTTGIVYQVRMTDACRRQLNGDGQVFWLTGSPTPGSSVAHPFAPGLLQLPLQQAAEHLAGAQSLRQVTQSATMAGQSSTSGLLFDHVYAGGFSPPNTFEFTTGDSSTAHHWTSSPARCPFLQMDLGEPKVVTQVRFAIGEGVAGTAWRSVYSVESAGSANFGSKLAGLEVFVTRSNMFPSDKARPDESEAGRPLSLHQLAHGSCVPPDPDTELCERVEWDGESTSINDALRAGWDYVATRVGSPDDQRIYRRTIKCPLRVGRYVVLQLPGSSSVSEQRTFRHVTEVTAYGTALAAPFGSTQNITRDCKTGNRPPQSSFRTGTQGYPYSEDFLPELTADAFTSTVLPAYVPHHYRRLPKGIVLAESSLSSFASNHAHFGGCEGEVGTAMGITAGADSFDGSPQTCADKCDATEGCSMFSLRYRDHASGAFVYNARIKGGGTVGSGVDAGTGAKLCCTLFKCDHSCEFEEEAGRVDFAFYVAAWGSQYPPKLESSFPEVLLPTARDHRCEYDLKRTPDVSASLRNLRCGGAAGSDQPLNCDQLCGGIKGYCAACDSVDGALRGLCCRSGLEAGVLTGSTSGDCAAVPAANYITSGYGQCVYVESKWRLASHVVASSEAASNPLESAFDREPFGALFHNNFEMPSYESVDRCPGMQIDLGAVKEVSHVRLAHPARLGRLRRAYFRSMVFQNSKNPNDDGAIETTSPELNFGFQVAVTEAAKFPSTGGNCAVDATTGKQNANCVALAAQSDCFSFDASAELCEEVKYNGVDFVDGWRMIGYQTKAMPSNDANDALLDRVLDCGGKRGRYVHLLHPGSSSSHAEGFAMSITEFGVFSHRCDTTDYDDATYSLAPPGAAVCPQNLGVTVFGDFCRDAVRLLARRLFNGKAPSGEENKLYTGQSRGEEKCGAPRRGREATDGNALWRHKPLGCSMDLTNYTAHFRTGDVGLGYVDNADCAANRSRYSLVCMRLKEGQTYSLGAGASCPAGDGVAPLSRPLAQIDGGAFSTSHHCMLLGYGLGVAHRAAVMSASHGATALVGSSPTVPLRQVDSSASACSTSGDAKIPRGCSLETATGVPHFNIDKPRAASGCVDNAAYSAVCVSEVPSPHRGLEDPRWSTTTTSTTTTTTSTTISTTTTTAVQLHVYVNGHPVPLLTALADAPDSRCQVSMLSAGGDYFSSEMLPAGDSCGKLKFRVPNGEDFRSFEMRLRFEAYQTRYPGVTLMTEGSTNYNFKLYDPHGGKKMTYKRNNPSGGKVHGNYVLPKNEWVTLKIWVDPNNAQHLRNSLSNGGAGWGDLVGEGAHGLISDQAESGKRIKEIDVELCGWKCGGRACPGGCHNPPQNNIYKIATLPSSMDAVPTTTATAGALVTTRRVTLEELEGADGFSLPLTHQEDDSNIYQGNPENKCAHAHGSADSPPIWALRFKDGEKHHVSKIRLWNRAECCWDRLNGACLRFSLDGTVPPNTDQNQNCDDYLPATVLANSGPGSGTWVVIDRWIAGMAFISLSPQNLFHLCGLEIYEETTTRLCTREDFVGEQGPALYTDRHWWLPLTHHEDDSNAWPGKCTHTHTRANQHAWNPAYWFAQFKDGKRHKVQKIRLWNRPESPHRLHGACVRFATDGSKPSHADPSQNCDDYLPTSIDHNSGPGSGTEVAVDRSITGMMIIATHTESVISICGIEIYEDVTAMTTTTTTTTAPAISVPTDWLNRTSMLLTTRQFVSGEPGLIGDDLGRHYMNITSVEPPKALRVTLDWHDQEWGTQEGRILIRLVHSLNGTTAAEHSLGPAPHYRKKQTFVLKASEHNVVRLAVTGHRRKSTSAASADYGVAVYDSAAAAGVKALTTKGAAGFGNGGAAAWSTDNGVDAAGALLQGSPSSTYYQFYHVVGGGVGHKLFVHSLRAELLTYDPEGPFAGDGSGAGGGGGSRRTLVGPRRSTGEF